MADSYIDTVKAKRQQAQFAKLLQNPRQSVILSAQADLGSKIEYVAAELIKAVKGLDTADMQKKQLAAIEQLGKEVHALQTAIDRQTIQLMGQYRKLSPIPSASPAPAAPADELSGYRAHDLDNASGGKQYVGFMNEAGKWYIMENDDQNNTLRYYFGKGSYERAWDDRNGHSYKRLSEARRG